MVGSRNIFATLVLASIATRDSSLATRDWDDVDEALNMTEDEKSLEKSCSYKGAPVLCESRSHRGCPSKAHLRCEGVLRPLRESFGVESEPWLIIKNIDRSIDLKTTTQSAVPLPNTPFELVQMSNDDFDTFKKIVTSYGEYMKTHKNSLLQRYLAIIKIHGAKRWVLRNRLFPVEFDVAYDLKGSKAKRSTSKDGIMKDLDFKDGGVRIEIPSTDQTGSIDTLDEDTQFLKKESLFDYSLMFSQFRFTMPICQQRGRSRCSAPVCEGDRCVDFSDESKDKHKQWLAVRDYFCEEGGGNRTKRLSKHMDSCIASFSFDGANTATVAFGCMGISNFLRAGDWGKWDGFKDWFRRWGTKEATIQNPKRYQSRFYDFMRKAVSKDGQSQYKVDFSDPQKLKRICQKWGKDVATLDMEGAIEDVELVDRNLFNRGDSGGGFLNIKTIGLIISILVCCCVGGGAYYHFAGKKEQTSVGAPHGGRPGYGAAAPQGQYGAPQGMLSPPMQQLRCNNCNNTGVDSYQRPCTFCSNGAMFMCQQPSDGSFLVGSIAGQQGDFGLSQPTQIQQQSRPGDFGLEQPARSHPF